MEAASIGVRDCWWNLNFGGISVGFSLRGLIELGRGWRGRSGCCLEERSAASKACGVIGLGSWADTNVYWAKENLDRNAWANRLLSTGSVLFVWIFFKSSLF
jgi:hypothetical protein